MAQNPKHVTGTVGGRAGATTNADTTPGKIHAVGSLVKAIEILTEGGNFSGVESIVHHIDQLRAAIQEKDQELKAQSVKIKEKEEEFQNLNSSCITAFRVESGRLERLVADEKANHESSKEVIKKLQQQIEQFQKAEASWKKKDRDAEISLSSEKKEKEAAKQKISDLEKRILSQSKRITDIEDDLQATKNEAAEASRTLKEVQRENEELKQDFEEVEEELSELQDFAVTLDSNNLESM